MFGSNVNAKLEQIFKMSKKVVHKEKMQIMFPSTGLEEINQSTQSRLALTLSMAIVNRINKVTNLQGLYISGQ